MVMKIRCTCCGSAKFVFTDNKLPENQHHGACCARCHKPLCSKDLLPDTTVDPIARCLIEQRKSR